MFRMKRKLEELNKSGKKIRVELVGIGKMGRGLINQMATISGMRPSICVDEKPQKAIDALIAAGVSSENIIFTNSKSKALEALEKDKFIVSEDYSIGLELEKIDAFVDATGNPPFGAKLAFDAINNKKHIIMLNVETDAVVGPILYKMARENGVIYTGTKGDEPGAILELADFAVGSGFELLVAGKGKNNPLNNYITEDEVYEEAVSKGLYPKMLTSFIDGTNTMIELTAVSNALGFTPDIIGCHGIKTDPKNISKQFSLKTEGGVLENYKIVDFAFGMAPGVFVIVTSEKKEVKDLMKYLNMGEGPNYLLYRPYHLTSLETPITIYDAVVENEATIVPEKGQISDVITVAKKIFLEEIFLMEWAPKMFLVK